MIVCRLPAPPPVRRTIAAQRPIAEEWRDPITVERVPWSRRPGCVSPEDYSAYLARQAYAEMAYEALDDFGREVDFLGARFEDYCDLPGEVSDG